MGTVEQMSDCPMANICGAVDDTYGWVCNEKFGHKGFHHMHMITGEIRGWNRAKKHDTIIRDRRKGKNEITLRLV